MKMIDEDPPRFILTEAELDLLMERDYEATLCEKEITYIKEEILPALEERINDGIDKRRRERVVHITIDVLLGILLTLSLVWGR